jgi:hypothetical protein
MRFIILAFFLFGCGAEDPIDYFKHKHIEDKWMGPAPFTDDFLKTYLDEYRQFAADNELGDGDILTMRRLEWTQQLSDNAVGICERFFSDQSGKLRYWNIRVLEKKYTKFQFKSLMFHEFAHCIHSAPHKEGSVHIMNPSLPREWILAENWNYLLDDLASYIKNKEWENEQ